MTKDQRVMARVNSRSRNRAARALAAAPAALPSEPDPGRRERRKAETRRRLLDATHRLFASRGYHATRPQDIARAADVAIGTFYLHFADKREAFLAFTDEATERLMTQMLARARDATHFEDGLRRALEALFEFSDQQPGVLGAAFADAAVIAAGVPRGASLRDRLALTVANALRRDMRRGALASDYDAEIVAHGIVGMIHAASVHGTAARRPSRDELIENLTRFCSRALLATGQKPAQA
jgi:AcrR family transcriptional regulator